MARRGYTAIMRRPPLLPLLLFAACAAAAPPATTEATGTAGTNGTAGGGGSRPAPDRTADRIAVLEAVFRYQFEHNESGLQDRAAAYCLCVPDGDGGRRGGGGDRDPDRALLDLLRGRKPPVLPCSACRMEGRRVVEVRDGQPALIFRVSSLRWRGRDEAEVEGGYGEGNLSASGQRFRVLRGEAGWKVVDVRGLWIS